MGRMYFENNRMIYDNGERREILYGYDELISNYSRIPIRYLGEGEDSLLGLVLESVNEHETIADGTNEKNASCEYATMDFLVAREHMKTPYELKVLEIGCSSGILSYHLAKMLGKYNENSRLCCVTDTIGNESVNGWIDKIARLESVPKLSFLATDYDAMPLAEGDFDVVILNASVVFEKKEAVLSEARRVLKNDGVFFAYVVEDVDLIQQIAYRSSVLKTYIYLPDRCLLRVEASDFMPLTKQENMLSYDVKSIVDSCKEMLDSEVSADEMRDRIRCLDEYISEAIAKQDLESKMLFIKYKGDILDKLVRKEYKK